MIVIQITNTTHQSFISLFSDVFDNVLHVRKLFQCLCEPEERPINILDVYYENQLEVKEGVYSDLKNVTLLSIFCNWSVT